MDPFIGEIRIFPFNFAPKGWATCDGQLMTISSNTGLFSLLGTNYGGDGRSTFALPKIGGSSTMSFGQGPGLTERYIGESSGEASLTLLSSEMPMHTHTAIGIATASQTDPIGHVWGNVANRRPAPVLYASQVGTAKQMNASALSLTGGNQPHNNLMPYVAMIYCISLQGIFPPRS